LSQQINAASHVVLIYMWHMSMLEASVTQNKMVRLWGLCAQVFDTCTKVKASQNKLGNKMWYHHSHRRKKKTWVLVTALLHFIYIYMKKLLITRQILNRENVHRKKMVKHLAFCWDLARLQESLQISDA